MADRTTPTTRRRAAPVVAAAYDVASPSIQEPYIEDVIRRLY